MLLISTRPSQIAVSERARIWHGGLLLFPTRPPVQRHVLSAATGGGSYFYSEITRPGSSSTAHTAGAELRDVSGGSFGIQYSPMRAPANESLQYEPRRKTLPDDYYNYTYDAENRLIKVAGNLDTQSKEFRYDYLHRRVQERQLLGASENRAAAISVYAGNLFNSRG
jgi:hypothetical protein